MRIVYKNLEDYNSFEDYQLDEMRKVGERLGLLPSVLDQMQIGFRDLYEQQINVIHNPEIFRNITDDTLVLAPEEDVLASLRKKSDYISRDGNFYAGDGAKILKYIHNALENYISTDKNGRRDWKGPDKMQTYIKYNQEASRMIYIYLQREKAKVETVKRVRQREQEKEKFQLEKTKLSFLKEKFPDLRTHMRIKINKANNKIFAFPQEFVNFNKNKPFDQLYQEIKAVNPDILSVFEYESISDFARNSADYVKIVGANVKNMREFNKINDIIESKNMAEFKTNVGSYEKDFGKSSKMLEHGFKQATDLASTEKDITEDN